MQYSKSTDYALHALLHLAISERRQNVGIKELSASLGVSESYLSKIMSKLRQDGLVRAVTGVAGGYELAKSAEHITFLEVIQVIEGRQDMYQCSTTNEQRHQLFFDAGDTSSSCEETHFGSKDCLVKKVMDGAEQHMQQYLQQHTIQSVLDAASFTNKMV